MSISTKDNTNVQKRDFRMDNIRFLLICAVVFAHLLETFEGGKICDGIYWVIYTFHVPALIFISGLFAGFKPEKIIKRLIIPYFVFQVLYLLFDTYVLGRQDKLSINFTSPYWIMWFILVLIYYYLVIPFISTKNPALAIVFFAVAVIFAVGVGYNASVGYFMSLSRAFVFLPFFLAGHYFASFEGLKKKLLEHRLAVSLVSALFMAATVYIMYFRWKVIAAFFYGSTSYDTTGTNAYVRLVAIIAAFCWIILLIAVVPDRKIPVVSRIGKNTLAIYLLHGFCQRLVTHFGIMGSNNTQNVLVSLGLTILIVGVFSLVPLGKLFDIIPFFDRRADEA